MTILLVLLLLLWLDRHLLILLPAILHVVFGLLHQLFSALLVALQQHAIARFVVGILFQGQCWRFGIEDKGIFALFFQCGVIAIQRPVGTLDGKLLLLEPLVHLNAMRNTMTIGNDQRGTIVGFCFQEGTQCLLVVGSHRNTCHIDAAIGHCQ